MRYLFSVKPEHVVQDETDLWAPEGEPIIPMYPHIMRNVFLSITSYKQSVFGEVKETDLDIDKLADRLKKMYPGLPDSLHNNYVLLTAVAATHFPVGTKLAIMLTENEATLKALNSETTFKMWDKQPMGDDV